MPEDGSSKVGSALDWTLPTTRGGEPLAYSRAPAPDVAPWIARLFVSIAITPAGGSYDCSLFNDVAGITVQLAGRAEMHCRHGTVPVGKTAYLMGPQSRLIAGVAQGGPHVSVGLHFRPGACFAFHGLRMPDYLDKWVNFEDMGLPYETVADRLDPEGSPEDWLRALEDMVRARVELGGSSLPDPVTAQFEAAAFTDPALPVARIAREIGIEQKKLERIVRRDFGLTPKQVLRLARALDLASHLRGVADTAEETELLLRYYDQSHINREFTEFFAMTPGQFAETPQSFLTASLELRQARRLESIERLASGAPRPWEERSGQTERELDALSTAIRQAARQPGLTNAGRSTNKPAAGAEKSP